MSFTFRIIMGLLPLLYLAPQVLFAAGQTTNSALTMPQPQAIRDPFTPSPLMFNEVGKQSGNLASGRSFMRTPNESVPQMRLRGFVDQGNGKSVALLEVGGSRTYLVREGDDITVNPSQANSVIRITKITRHSITVETGSILGSIRVQR